jgi:hypothetical protein
VKPTPALEVRNEARKRPNERLEFTMKRFSIVADTHRRQAAYEDANKVFQRQLFGDFNNDIGSALEFAFDAYCAALDIEFIEPAETGYIPEKASTIRLMVNLLTKEYDQWQRCNLEIGEKRRDFHDNEHGHPYDLRYSMYMEVHRAFESLGIEVGRGCDLAENRKPAPAPLAYLLPKKPWKTKDEAIAWAQSILRMSAGKKKRATKAVAKPNPAKRGRAAKSMPPPASALNGKGHVNGLANGAGAPLAAAAQA